MATAALDEAGENRTQLEQVIEHYTNVDADPQKLEATYYLIANMEDKVGYATTDTIGCSPTERGMNDWKLGAHRFGYSLSGIRFATSIA